MTPLPPEWREHFDALTAIRMLHGFVWVGTQEADTRAPGGDHLLWGRRPDNTLFVCVVEEDGTVHEWEQIDEAEFARRWPHTHVPASLPEDYEEEVEHVGRR